MSIQKLAASCLAATQETTFALAAFNIDFSLIKCEAPQEFQRIGSELTPKRKEAAESGRQHITARKLGALFQSWLPRTPHLIKAYGTRSSEIISRRDLNPKPSRSYGIFAEHVGIDGTSLWAAATSGPEAIPVHLLACFLARLWKPAQATSIWMELVEERKKELAAVEETDPLHHHSQHLSNYSIERVQLAEWDASARAWLQTADDAMCRKQKQLMLILNNVSLPVNTKPVLYESVMVAWKRAMEVTEELIQGRPQSVQNGAVLLGLSSWHLYPDLLVLQQTPVSIKQQDSLVDPGGILTVGLQMDGAGHDGVYWSLSLGHLRYYSGSVMSQRCLDAANNRVTAPQLVIVAIGCMSKAWHWHDKQVASFLIHLWGMIHEASLQFSEGTLYWVGHLAEAMESYFSEDQLVKKQSEQLLRFGRNRCSGFVDATDTAFGLNKIGKILDLIESFKDRWLFAQRLHPLLQNHRPAPCFLVRYRELSKPSAFMESQHGYLQRPSKRSKQDPMQASRKRRKYTETHKRSIEWLQIEYDGNNALGAACTTTVKSAKCEEPREPRNGSVEIDDLDKSQSETQRRLLWIDPPPELPSCWIDTVGSRRRTVLRWLAGDRYRGAIFVAAPPQYGDTETLESQGNIGNECLEPGRMLELLNQSLLSPNLVMNHLHGFIMGTEQEGLLRSLMALATIKHIYKMLPDTTVNLSMTDKPLHGRAWVATSMTRRKFRLLPMDRGQTFSCIALLESGTYSLSPASLSSVMAMATGNSIFISAELLSDPSDQASGCEIRRIRGGIGKPGIAMMVSVPKPQIRDSSKDWSLVNHIPFDGRLEDCFYHTTLHLRFTDYTLPIDVGGIGLRDIEIYFLEAVVSIHDKGEWVADLDILRCLKSSLLSTRVCPSKHMPEGSTESFVDPSSPSEDAALVAIDNWAEIFDQPNGCGLVRSTGNWLGRLATTALSVQLGYRTIVLSRGLCGSCLFQGWYQTKTRGAGRFDDETQFSKTDCDELLVEIGKSKLILIC